MSIQPVNKAAEYPINLTPELEKRKKKRRRTRKAKKQQQQQQQKAVNAYLIKNSRGKGEGGTITSSRKD